MLVLTRRVGETIVIDDTITVTVLSVEGHRIRLGITAPPAVTVDRQEVHERRQEFAPPGPDRTLKGWTPAAGRAVLAGANGK